MESEGVLLVLNKWECVFLEMSDAWMVEIERVQRVCNRQHLAVTESMMMLEDGSVEAGPKLYVAISFLEDKGITTSLL